MSETNPNQDIIDMLIELGKNELSLDPDKGKFKNNAYRKAAQSVGQYNKRIETAKEAQKLSGVGPKIAQKIEDFVKNGTIPQLHKVIQLDNTSAIDQLIRVSGIGAKTAAKLCGEGIDSIEKLKKIAHSLTPHQKIGLKYVEEFEQKIPRKEIQEIEKILFEKTRELSQNLLMTICGSYRRGLDESGDIDVLISHKKITSEQMDPLITYLKDFVKSLEKCGLLTDRISLGDKKFMGVCRLSSDRPHRRIDIMFLPLDHYFCGILYFTGSAFFNKQMRSRANELGFTLNEYSLRKLGETGVPGEPIPISSEEEIFEYIDFPYKEPKDRND